METVLGPSAHARPHTTASTRPRGIAAARPPESRAWLTAGHTESPNGGPANLSPDSIEHGHNTPSSTYDAEQTPRVIPRDGKKRPSHFLTVQLLAGLTAFALSIWLSYELTKHAVKNGTAEALNNTTVHTVNVGGQNSP